MASFCSTAQLPDSLHLGQSLVDGRGRHAFQQYLEVVHCQFIDHGRSCIVAATNSFAYLRLVALLQYGVVVDMNCQNHSAIPIPEMSLVKALTVQCFQLATLSHAFSPFSLLLLNLSASLLH